MTIFALQHNVTYMFATGCLYKNDKGFAAQYF